MYNATVKSIRELHPDLRVFKIAMNDGASLNFTPGQFSTLGLIGNDGNMIMRAYSIASNPANAEVEFFIVKKHDGLFTPKLFELKVGDQIFMNPRCVGHMSLSHVPETTDMLWVATGTGIVPFMSLLRSVPNICENRKVVLIYGARQVHDLGYMDELNKFQKDFPNFHFFPIASREELNGRIGRVNIIFDLPEFKSIFPVISPDSMHIFMCGSVAMINDHADNFQKIGFVLDTPINPGQLHIEKY